MSASPERKRSEHPGLHSVLEKLHRRVSVTAEDLQILVRQIEELEQRAVVEREEGQQIEPAGTTPEWDLLAGHSSHAGTERFAADFGKETVAFYREAQDLLISSVGIGTYRGPMDCKTDAGYEAAVHTALQSGVNLIDTSLNYRDQRSERCVGAGVRLHIERTGGARRGIVVCTKGGYLVRGAITPGTLETEDVVGGRHSMAPSFLADQIERSRRNLGLETIDVYYLHNPEVQLEFVEMSEFMNRIRVAFELLERSVSQGFIRYYGTATWNGYRGGGLSLQALADTAHQVAGAGHHFRFIQLPFNLGMQQALEHHVEGGSVLSLARQLGITVVTSAALMQARLVQDLPSELTSGLPGLNSDAQRALQFARSAPGVTAALVGMSNSAHVLENLRVSRVAPLTAELPSNESAKQPVTHTPDCRQHYHMRHHVGEDC